MIIYLQCLEVYCHYFLFEFPPSIIVTNCACLYINFYFIFVGCSGSCTYIFDTVFNLVGRLSVFDRPIDEEGVQG